LAFAVALFFLFPKTRDRPLSAIEAPFVWFSAVITGVVEGISSSSGDLWQRYVDLGQARVENRQLLAERDLLLNKLSYHEEAVMRADRLEALLVLKQETPQETVSARVIGGDSTRWFRSLLLDRGSRDGIRVGDGVITPLGVVGRVASVTHRTAQVLALNNRGCIVPARLARTRQAGILKGGPRPAELPVSQTNFPLNPALLSLLKYVPRAADVSIGDRVITSGLERNFPAGIPIGTVAAVVREEAEVFAKVYVTPEALLTTLEEVLVVIDAKPASDAEPEG
jgi:rod shape-determining protein MreC